MAWSGGNGRCVVFGSEELKDMKDAGLASLQAVELQ